MICMNRQMFFMFYRVLVLFFKDCFGIKKNYLDHCIYSMLDEYSYYFTFKDDLKWRPFND